MFKDVFVLRKTAWHARMMKYIWGLDHGDFSHICPYWWLSVFNFLIIVELLIIKEGYRLIVYILNLTFTLAWTLLKPKIISYRAWQRRNEEKREIRRLAKEKIRREKEQVLYKKWADYYKANPDKLLEIKREKESVYDKIIRKIAKFHYDDYNEICTKVYLASEKLEQEQWVKDAEKAKQQAQEYLERQKKKFLSIYQGDDTEALLADNNFEAYLRTWEKNKKQSEIEKEAARRRANKDRINRILKIVKYPTTIIAYTLGSAAVLIGVYYIIMFFKWCYDGIASIKHSSWVSFGKVMSYIGTVALSALLIFLLIYGMFSLIRYLEWNGWPKWLRYRTYFPKKYRHITPMLPHELVALTIRLDKRREKSARRKQRRRNFWDGFWYGCEKFCDIFVFLWKKVICKAARAVRGAVLFLIQMLKNNCPAIKWED